jgi:hypothetical protein
MAIMTKLVARKTWLIEANRFLIVAFGMAPTLLAMRT